MKKSSLHLRTRDDIQDIVPMIGGGKKPNANDWKAVKEWIKKDKARNRKKSSAKRLIIAK